MLIAAALLLVTGIVLLTLGLRGRRIGAAPHCRRCGFDLSGLAEKADVCPECGTKLRGRSIARGERKRRPVLTAAGAMLVLLSTGLGLLGGAIRGGFNPTPYKPVTLLSLDLERGITTDRDEALAELSLRLQSGRLTGRQAQAIADRILKLQGDRSFAWKPPLGDWIEAAHAAGLLRQEQFRTYMRQAPQFALVVRPRVSRTAYWLPNEISYLSARAGSTPSLRISTGIAAVSVNGEPVTAVRGGGISSVLSSSGQWARGGLPLRIRESSSPPLAPGEHQLLLDFRVTIAPELMPEVTETLVIPFSATFTSVEESEDAITLRSGAELDAQVRASVHAIGPGFFMPYHGNDGMGHLHVRNLPVALSMDLFWRTREDPPREFRITSITCRPSDSGMRNYSGPRHLHPNSRLPDDLPMGATEVILRPSVGAALNTHDLVEIWGGELHLGTIELERNETGNIPYPWREAHELDSAAAKPR